MLCGLGEILNSGVRMFANRAALALCLVLGIAAPLSVASAIELSIPDVEIRAGATINIPVRVADAKGLSALQMRLVFEASEFDLIEVVAGPILPNALVDFKMTKGIAAIAFASSDQVAADGELLILKMRRREGALGGSVILPTNTFAWGGDASAPMQVVAKRGAIAPLTWVNALRSALDARWLAAGSAALMAILGAVGLLYARRKAKSRQVEAASVPSGLAQATPAESPFRPPTPDASEAKVLNRGAPPASGSPHFCSECGAPLAPHVKYCANCGLRLVPD